MDVRILCERWVEDDVFTGVIICWMVMCVFRLQLRLFSCIIELCTCSARQIECSGSRRRVIAVTPAVCRSSVVWCMPVTRVAETCINVAVSSWTSLLNWRC